MLPVRAAGHRHFGAALGQVGHRRKGLADQSKENLMRPTQQQQITGLRNVLRRSTPMHPTAVRIADHTRKFPDQRHKSVAGARQAFVDARAIQEFKAPGTCDGVGRRGGNDRQLCLRLGQSHLDVEPGLPTALQTV